MFLFKKILNRLYQRIMYCICIFCFYVIILLLWFPLAAHIHLFFFPPQGVYIQYSFDPTYNKPLISSVFIVEPGHTATDSTLEYSTYLFSLDHICICNMKLSEQYFRRLSAQFNLRSIILENCDFDNIG
jgi:hypothetical protein